MIEHPRVWLWVAIAVTTAVLFGWTEWTLRTRRLELGVIERAGAMRALLWALVIAVALVGLMGRAQAGEAACLALAIGGALLTASAVHADAVSVGRAARRTVVLALVGGGVGVLGASVAAGSYADEVWFATLLTAAAALAIGSAVGALEAPLRPAGGAWLDAFARAADEAVRPNPQEAIQATLLALRAPEGAGAPSPELWTFPPIRVTTIDAAGYAHERDGDLPDTLLLVASAEPEATLRAEVLDALEVRRPDIRPLVQWLNDRGAMLATVIACDAETEGLLVLPRGGRSEPVTLEEVRAFKRVADRLATACRARGTQTRMLERARDAAARAAEAQEQIERLLHDRALDAQRDALATARLARPATVGVYSATSRSLARGARAAHVCGRADRRRRAERRRSGAVPRARPPRGRPRKGAHRARRRDERSRARSGALDRSERVSAGARAPRDARAPRRRGAPGRHPAARRPGVQREARALGAARSARRAAGAHGHRARRTVSSRSRRARKARSGARASPGRRARGARSCCPACGTARKTCAPS